MGSTIARTLVTQPFLYGYYPLESCLSERKVCSIQPRAQEKWNMVGQALEDEPLFPNPSNTNSLPSWVDRSIRASW
jgi:hypothetical protein